MCPDAAPHPHGFLRRPGPKATALLERYQQVLDRAAPLAAKHRRTLPLAVQELSALLTKERADLGGDYLRAPRFLHAYVRYFLPWNLFRLATLLPGLAPGLGLADTAGEQEKVVVDLGSGPLTALQALWISCPELRSLNLRIHCLDRSKQVMGMGRDLLDALAAGAAHAGKAVPKGKPAKDAAQDSGQRNPWRVRLVQAPLAKGLGELRGKAHLMFAVNVLNEVARTGQASLSGLRETAHGFTRMALAKLHRGGESGAPGRLLVVEPGTRLGGTLVSLVREAALEMGATALSPCPHNEECPALVGETKMWCHFRSPVENAPGWLGKLSRQAGLGKETAALSAVLLCAGPSDQATPMARVLSDPLRVTGGVASYGCAREGLVLLRQENALARPLAQGDVVSYALDPEEKRDAKSGALEAVVPAASGRGGNVSAGPAPSAPDE